jgi:hypothetical protein
MKIVAAASKCPNPIGNAHTLLPLAENRLHSMMLTTERNGNTSPELYKLEKALSLEKYGGGTRI